MPQQFCFYFHANGTGKRRKPEDKSSQEDRRRKEPTSQRQLPTSSTIAKSVAFAGNVRHWRRLAEVVVVIHAKVESLLVVNIRSRATRLAKGERQTDANMLTSRSMPSDKRTFVLPNYRLNSNVAVGGR